MPTGRADAEWQGIPILPFAFAGEELEDGSGYRFTVRGNETIVERFYTAQLPGLGWEMFMTGEGEGDSKMLLFKQGNSLLTISIVEIDEVERYMMVMIVLTR